MSYRLVIDGTDADLFPEYEISINFDAFSSEEIGQLRYPFNFSNNLPYTSTNRGIFGGYDYTSAFGDLTNEQYEYTLYSGGVVISKGLVNASSVVVNAAEPYFECNFNDLSLDFVQRLKALSMGDIYRSSIDAIAGDTISETTQTLYTWLTTETDYAGRDIELPYVDFDNGQSKFGYNARQFTAWGTTDKKVGLMPALNVQNFIRRCFAALGYVSSYVSKFGGTTGTPTWSSTNLYMLYPSRLLSDTADQKSTNLAPYTSNIYKNQSQIVGDNDWDVEGYVVAGEYTPYIPTNYDPTLSIDEYDYGTQFKTPANIGVADVDYRSGFVGYSVGFDGRITFGGGATSSSIDDMRVCVYSVSYFDGTYTRPYVVENINDANSAYFIPTIVIWESGVPKYRLPLKDVSGNILELQASAIEQATQSIDYQDDHTGGGTHAPNNILYFESFTGYLDEVREFVASNKYQLSFEMEMTGYLDCQLENHAHTSSITQNIYYDDIKKMRVFDYTYSNLDIRIVTDDAFLAALPDDEFQYRLSLDTANTYTPYELFIEIVNRFGLSLVYNYSSNKFYLDTMDDMRVSTQSIDPQVDDINLYTIYSAGLPYNKIRLLNKDFGGLYDKFPNDLAVGSYDGIFDASGSGDITVQLEGGLINPINKTVCGDPVEQNWDILKKEGITEQQAGFITNEIRDYDLIGLRFGYLSSPAYNTNIRYPKYLGITYLTAFPSSSQVVDGLTYDLLANVKMQGLFGDTGSSGTLRFADRDGNTQAFYNYYVGLERIASNGRTSMEFNAVIPTSWISNNYQYSRTFTFTSTGEDFVIESMEGTVYEDVVYATLKIKFL